MNVRQIPMVNGLPKVKSVQLALFCAHTLDLSFPTEYTAQNIENFFKEFVNYLHVFYFFLYQLNLRFSKKFYRKVEIFI